MLQDKFAMAKISPAKFLIPIAVAFVLLLFILEKMNSGHEASQVPESERAEGNAESLIITGDDHTGATEVPVIDYSDRGMSSKDKKTVNM